MGVEKSPSTERKSDQVEDQQNEKEVPSNVAGEDLSEDEMELP